MLKIKEIHTPNQFPENLTRAQFIDFLHEHLSEFRDSKQAIGNAIDYAFSDSEGKGGFLLAAFHEDEIVGGLVMNDTGMAGYIPEHILVYIAVNSAYRGQGFGRQICEKALEMTPGNVALHVEYDNPAKRLYERIGFTSKYAEMRYQK